MIWKHAKFLLENITNLNKYNGKSYAPYESFILFYFKWGFCLHETGRAEKTIQLPGPVFTVPQTPSEFCETSVSNTGLCKLEEKGDNFTLPAKLGNLVQMTYENSVIYEKLFKKLKESESNVTFTVKQEWLTDIPVNGKDIKSLGICAVPLQIGNKNMVQNVHVVKDLEDLICIEADCLLQL